MDDLEKRYGEFSRIKEILFGEEFQSLETRLEGLRSELLAVVENQVNTLEGKLKTQEEAFDRKLDGIRQQMAGLGQKSGELDQRLQTAFNELKTLGEQVSQQNEQNREALLSLKTELMEAIQVLEKAKVDKTEIAEMFGLMIRKLK